MAKKNTTETGMASTGGAALSRRGTARRGARPVERPQASDANVATMDVPRDSGASGHTPSYDEIAEAAYHRYLQRGRRDGRDFDDWVEAERDLRSRSSE